MKQTKPFVSFTREVFDATTGNCVRGQLTAARMPGALDRFPRCAPGTGQSKWRTVNTLES
ncbi:hypothetical protein AWB74_08179 [Caballeronia arvi]|uniref:Uncharacterized protein n=1 Tax=Caballeronia arvi TaxID=1777135 RepID=A0A158L3Q5_9BURK|nr:hypothetical protein AWB74_08179 [Caballeronia arvi]